MSAHDEHQATTAPAGADTTSAKARLAAEAAALEAADLVTDIRAALDQLLDLVRLVRTLNSSRQSTGLGFLTATTRAELDEAIRDDRRHRRTQPARNTVGLAWLNRDTVVSGTGHVPAAVTIPAVSADAHIAATLHTLVRRVTRLAYEGGVCLLRPLTADPDTGDLVRHLHAIAGGLTSRKELRALLRDLKHLVELADQTANGAARTWHDDPCPYCGRRSLVINHRDDVIRCEADSVDDRLHPCICDDAYCQCHRRPFSTRHEWHRTHATAPSLRHTWSSLSNLLTINRELTTMETKALDAVQRVRDLHQPGWTDDAGTWHDHYVVVAGRDLPADHICRIGAANHESFEVCVIDPDSPDDSEHVVPACVECRQAYPDDGDLTSYLFYPCPTIRALDDPDTTPPTS